MQQRRITEDALKTRVETCRRTVATNTGVLTSAEELQRETEELLSEFQVFMN